MRWVRFDLAGYTRIGYLKDGLVQPVQAASLLDVIAGVETDAAGSALPFESLNLLAPLRPPKIVCVGLNYMDHCREQKVEPPPAPLLFSKYPTSVIGPEELIRWPKGLTEQVDFEVELAVVIGKTARMVREDDALSYVFGYTAANDVSARDLQFGDGQWTRGKSLDTFCPLGPVVVTADEIPDPQKLPLQCRVNGVAYQDSNTSEMIFPVAQLIAYISRAYTLEPGDVILTGTPHGVGVFRDPKVFMYPGDVVEIEVSDFGVLRNPIGEPIE
ncbi:MAG: fumarylacetoacetate hydrolase family protein [Anaerolineales bacterium]|nr:fumarylacetoacetate hydrolase family protein [Anaerolineales bacterium]